MAVPFLVIANRNAGRFSLQLVDQVRRFLGDGGPVDVVVTDEPDDVEPALADLGERCPVVLGGDGSVHQMVNALDRRGLLDRPLGVLPAGTANALARGVGLPLDIASSSRRVRSGRRRFLDLVRADDGRIAVNDVHTGVGSATPQLVTWSKRVLGPLAYPVVNAGTAFATRGWDVTVHVDGKVVADEVVLAVAVGNGPVIGNGTPLWPGASPDDGRVEVLVLAAPRRWRRPRLALAVIRGQHGQHAEARTFGASTVRITGGPGAHNADGEQWPGVRDMTYTVQRGALSLLA